MCHQPIPYMHLHKHQSYEHQHQAPQLGVGSITWPNSAAQMWPLGTHIPGLLQDKAAAVSYLSTKGNLTPLHEVIPFGIPASS